MKARLLSIICILLMSIDIQAHNLEPLHVDGRYIKNSKGDIVTLHGYMTVLEPGCQADEYRSTWDGYNVAMCLKNKKAALDAVLKSGWKMDYVRFKLDSYWCCDQLTYNGEEYKSFDFERFKKYFEDLFLPLLDYYHEKGIYTLLFPPHTSPETIEIGDEFQQHMMLLWDYVSSHPCIKNNPGVLFELANEPINFNCHQGDSYWALAGYWANRSSMFKEVRDYWQPIVDKIRSHCDNVIYVPGMLYESDHAGFADYPVQGNNIGYAVHWYPGWWGDMRKDWEGHVFPIAYKAPIIITENAWAPYSNYLGGGPDASTSNFGRPLKTIIDELGNVSWNCYEPEEDYYYFVNSSSSSEKAVIANDPEACFKSMYQWWNEYAKTKVMPTSQLRAKNVSFDEFPNVLVPGQKVLAKIKAEFTNGMIWDVSGDAEYIITDESVLRIENGVIWGLKDGSTNITVKYTDGAGQVFSRQFEVSSTLFPLSAQGFNPNLHDDNGSFNESTGDYSTVSYNTGGWSYGEGLDLTPYKYIVVQLNHEQQCWATVRIWDDENVWSDNEAWDDKRGLEGFSFNNETELVIDLQTLHKQNGEALDLSHIYHIGIWINGELGSVSIKRVFLSNDGVTPANSYQEPICVYADNKVMFYGDEVPALTFSTSGPYIEGTPKLSTTANSASSVGIYPIMVEKGTVTNEHAKFIDGTLTVMKTPLMVGVEDMTITEGDAIPSFNLTYSGWRNSDKESNAFITKPTAKTTATSSSKAGTYPITVSGGSAKNYSLIYQQGTLTIQKKAEPVTITADNKSMTYGDDVPTLTYKSSGAKLNGTPKLSTTATKTSPVGTYPIKVEKGTVTNEAVTYVDGTLTISKAPLTVGVQNVTITEGDAIPAFTLTYNGFRNGDTESKAFTKKPTAKTTATSSSKAGTYPITVSGGEAKNYALTYKQGILTIKEKPEEPVTITANEISMVYGDEVPTLTYSTKGGTLKGTPKLSTTATKTSPVGTYPIKVERGTVTNGQVTFVDGTLTITKAPLTIGVKDETITEGDPIPTFTLTYDGWKNGDTEATAFTRKPKAKTTATSESKAGTYPITITTGTAKNYKITYQEGTLTIKEKEPTSTWTNIVVNGDMESSDLSCFYKRENYAENEAVVSATIGKHSGKDGSRGITVKSVDNPADTWNTQFFVRLPQTIPAGTNYRLSFDYKATREAYVLMEIHAEPGVYIYYDFDHMSFNTTWQHYESEGTITGEMSPDENKMRTIAFDLAHEKTATTYYFDNIVFEIFSTSAINTLNADYRRNVAVYNLSGQKLSQPQKGINIINGKKVVVK